MVLKDRYGERVEHRTKYRLGELTGLMLRTRHGWAMKVDARDGSEYWLNIDGPMVLASGVPVGRVVDLAPVGDRPTASGAYTARETDSPTLDELLEHDAYWLMMSEQEGYPFMVVHGMPVRVFLGNLYRWGFKVSVDDNGALRVSPPPDYTPPPAFLEEIRIRKALLVEVLTPRPPAQLEPYFGRLVKGKERDEVEALAQELGVGLRWTRCGNHWLIEVEEEPVPVARQPIAQMEAA